MTTQKKIQVEYRDPRSLQPNPWNTNKVGPEAEGKLDNSLLEFGIYKPIICRELPDGVLQILGGEHRTRAAIRAGEPTVPVINLGAMSDARAKALGLADNGQYGTDDATGLAALLAELREADDGQLLDLLPFSDEDLAGILASANINLDDIGVGDDSHINTAAPALDDLPARPTITHELMRFKVPVADREMVEKLFQRVIKERGLKTEDDSLVAAGMALVEICNAAKETM